MDAITTCARNGVSIAGAALFTTTFPCHSCTRHIVAAGISRVVCIEPYPKSQACQLHGDAICLAPCSESDKLKIPFEPFVGIGPKRFFDLFSLKLSAGYRVERKLRGEMIEWRLETHAKPRVPMAPHHIFNASSTFQEQSLQFTKRKVQIVADQELQVKTGEAYRALMEKTAARVEKWPQWKVGEKSTRRSEPAPTPDRTNCLSDPPHDG